MPTLLTPASSSTSSPPPSGSNIIDTSGLPSNGAYSCLPSTVDSPPLATFPSQDQSYASTTNKTSKLLVDSTCQLTETVSISLSPTTTNSNHTNTQSLSPNEHVCSENQLIHLSMIKCLFRVNRIRRHLIHLNQQVRLHPMVLHHQPIVHLLLKNVCTFRIFPFDFEMMI